MRQSPYVNQGPYGARPYGITVPRMGPAAGTTPTADPSSMLANPLRRDDEGWIEIDLQNPADSSADPTLGVYWEIPLVDVFGQDLASVNARGFQQMELEVDALLADGALVTFGLLDAPEASSVRGYGGCLIGNGGTQNDGSRLHKSGVSWTSVAYAGSANARRLAAYQGIFNFSQYRGYGSALLEADRTFVSESGAAALSTIGTHTLMWIGAGWNTAVPAASTATVRLRVFGMFLDTTQIEGSGLLLS